MERVLVTGACGQLGSELSMALAGIHGSENVIVSDINGPIALLSGMTFEILDVMDRQAISEVILRYGITQVYHLAAMLSAKSEQNPELAWKLNVDGLINVLECCRQQGISRVFWPSSIAAFGPSTPSEKTPQHSVMDPNTVYGISKLTGELWCSYYFNQFGLDIRSVRYPGLISYKAPPGGGTTDYAIEIFHSAIKGEEFVCYLKQDTQLPMMYMPDAIKAAVQLMQAPASQIKVRTSYNISAIDFTAAQLAAEIMQHIPGFKVKYLPDYRQEIAATWPGSLDDSCAMSDWSWQADHNLKTMTEDMIRQLFIVRTTS
ncbi:MAG: NAD-dependent epimerase/dehydratase family protein [Cyclobacteriaceae bacterium]|nr:NAD-dependent epimerase/dehydratase family protein [Cyclobacteriaceae bacterium]